jgi:hypothetical protein
MLRVTVGGGDDDPVGADGDRVNGDSARGAVPAGAPARTRWVALRTIDASGRPGEDVAIPDGTARYVVAWTSPEVEKAARAREGD